MMQRNSPLTMLAVAAGAVLATYYLDPQQGRRRRARLRDQVYGRLSHFDEAAGVVAVDLRNRLLGTLGGLRQRMRREAVPDEVLTERVRAKLGRVVSHPGSIEVAASEGAVTLRGPVLARERKSLLRSVDGTPGVERVVDQLEAHEQAGEVPGLQGGAPREQRIDIAQEHWAPATRLLVGFGGAALTYRGLARRSAATPFLLLAGGALLARASTNMDMKRLLGQRGRRGIDLIKTLQIAAPVDEVFAVWRDFENFPRFMRNVHRVYRNPAAGWHWEVAGPLGTTVQWDATVTQLVPNELIAWSTLPGSTVQHAGTVRFQHEEGATRVQVEMSYSPPAGALGHMVASLFGADPQNEMDEDLMRMKSFLETGKPARDAAVHTAARLS